MLYISKNNLVTTNKAGVQLRFETGKRYKFEEIGEGVDLTNFTILGEAEAAALDAAAKAKKGTAPQSAPLGEVKTPEGAEEVK